VVCSSQSEKWSCRWKKNGLYCFLTRCWKTVQTNSRFSARYCIIWDYQASDDIVDRISDWLSNKDEDKSSEGVEYPYLVRDDFLSHAEPGFYLVLKTALSDLALNCTKVSLGALFNAKSSDPKKGPHSRLVAYDSHFRKLDPQCSLFTFSNCPYIWWLNQAVRYGQLALQFVFIRSRVRVPQVAQ
jgi:hypothetical protein